LSETNTTICFAAIIVTYNRYHITLFEKITHTAAVRLAILLHHLKHINRNAMLVCLSVQHCL